MERYTGAEFGSPFRCALDVVPERYDGEATLSISKEMSMVVVSFESEESPSWVGNTDECEESPSWVRNTDTFIIASSGGHDRNIPVCVTSVNYVVKGNSNSNLSGYIIPGKWFRRADDLVFTKFSFAALPPALQADTVSLGTSGWDVCLKESSDPDGLGVTHSGTLWRSDKTPFSTDEAYQVLTSMALAFSFLTGNYRIPVLVEGVRDDSTSSTAMVGKLHTNSKSQCNWFSGDCDIDVIDVAKAILSSYAGDGDHLRNIITKYVESELAFRGGAYQAALTMAQSCLEGLMKWKTNDGQSSVILLDEKGRPKKKSQIITDLLKSSGIRVTNEEIKALTDFRNNIVHADILDNGFVRQVHSVWNKMQLLSEIWFLEELGCTGRIRDRRKLWEEYFQLPESKL